MSTWADVPLAGDRRHAEDDLVVIVPCAARPSTGFVHLDGPCRCFVGGPAPEFAPSMHVAQRSA